MADKKDETKKGGGKAWIGALALCTLVAVGTGAGLGMYLMTSVEKAADQKAREAQEHEKAARVLNYAGELSLRSVGSVVTNLAEPADSWIRLESSVVFKTGSLPTPDVTVAEIKADIIAYLRTLSTAQIEGASGLQHLREDLNERVSLRTKGAIRELIVEALVVQ